MMNRLFKRGMVIALAAAMTTSAGIPAMAAQKETQEETVTIIRGNTNKCRLWFSHSEGD